MVELKKLLYNPIEVAELLSMSKSQVHVLIRDGKLEAHCHNGIGVKPVKITAMSIGSYYNKYLVPSEDWLE